MNQNNCFLKKGNEKTVTHVSMDGFLGGRFHIPFSQNATFLELYARTLDSGCKWFISENGTENFNFFIDLDLPTGKPPLKPDQLEKFMRITLETIRLFLDEDAKDAKSKLVVLSASEEGGVHVNFPGLVVDVQQALVMVHAIDCKIAKEPGLEERPLDRKVYGGSVGGVPHLRMLGSRKADKCPSCNRKKNVSCIICCNGKVDLGRAYSVRMVYQDGIFNRKLTREIAGNFYRALELCSLRTNKEPVKWKPYEGCPRPEPEVKTKKSGKLKASVLTAQQMQVLQMAFIRLSPKYSRLHVVSTKSEKNQDFLILCVAGDFDRYCLNKKSEHGSSKIYFTLTPKSLDQRCYSGKLYNKVLCSGFRQSTALTFQEQRFLFPHKTFAENPLQIQQKSTPHQRFGSILDQTICLLQAKMNPVEKKSANKKKRKR
jgi:hypothetical protein